LFSLLVYVGTGGLLLRCFLGLQGGPYNSLTIPCGVGPKYVTRAMSHETLR